MAGDVKEALGPGGNGNLDDAKSGVDFPPVGSPAGDDAGYELDITMKCSSQLQFQYVFASRELPQYGGQQYNDVFKMTTTTGSTVDNVAFFTENNVKKDVTINNITPACSQATGTWASIFIPNFSAGGCTAGGGSKDSYTGRKHFSYTGYTVRLTAQHELLENQETKLNITIEDTHDGIFDSVVFLQKGSLKVRQLGRIITDMLPVLTISLL